MKVQGDIFVGESAFLEYVRSSQRRESVEGILQCVDLQCCTNFNKDHNFKGPSLLENNHKARESDSVLSKYVL